MLHNNMATCIFFLVSKTSRQRDWETYGWKGKETCYLDTYASKNIFIFQSQRLISFSTFTHVFYLFSRNDASGKRFREAEGEASPQSPPAGALLLKKKGEKKRKKREKKKLNVCQILSKIFEFFPKCSELSEAFWRYSGGTQGSVVTAPPDAAFGQ